MLTEVEIKFIESFAPVPARLDHRTYIDWDMDALQVITSLVQRDSVIALRLTDIECIASLIRLKGHGGNRMMFA